MRPITKKTLIKITLIGCMALAIIMLAGLSYNIANYLIIVDGSSSDSNTTDDINLSLCNSENIYLQEQIDNRDDFIIANLDNLEILGRIRAVCHQIVSEVKAKILTKDIKPSLSDIFNKLDKHLVSICIDMNKSS